MHTNEPRELQGVELGYDPRDIHVGPITKVVIWFFVFTVISFGGMAVWYIRSGQTTSFTRDARKPAIVGPLIQSNTASKTEIMEVRQKERQIMETYDVDPATGTVKHIPVEHALDLIADRGLPTVSSNEPAKSLGTTIPQNAIGAGTSVPHSEEAPASPSVPSGKPASPATTGP